MRGHLSFPVMPISLFEDDYVDVVVLRGGGHDQWGEPRPVEEIVVKDCLVGGSSTSDDTPRSEVVDSTANLYRGPGFTFQSTDRVVVPSGAPMAGEWAVEGIPQEWAQGVHVALRRD